MCAVAEAPHLVILGAGFAGLAAAREGARANLRVTVVDRRNHHVFQPLLYQVATAALSAPDVAAPIRSILRRHAQTAVVMDEVVSLDLDARRALLAGGGAIGYDYLIVATGATHSYFGHDEWAPYAPGLKTLEDALEIRRRLLLAFERAEQETNPDRRRAYMTFVVVGGGPTGVELAGALAEIARHTLRGDFRNIDPATARVVLLEAADRVLPPYRPELSAEARRQLEDLGVEVHTNGLVTAVDEGGVCLRDERLEARTVLWAAGVAASPLGRALRAPLDRAGRVQVTRELVVPGRADVFVAGDLAAFEQDSRPVPGVAPAAMQMGRHAARNVARLARGETPQPFRYVDKGSLATIGRKAAVADFGRLRLSGLPAWLAWLGIHIFFLIGFRNRFVVMFEWAWAYLSYQRSARIILEPGGAVVAPPRPPGASLGARR
jgi:NADH dehydrogenase